ncbi:MAG: hypothetical protein LBJ67_12140 [Planctomycetaceae bacterium]|nr:hypothetical protein [Planctomycetaceae bacterium]
MKLLRLTLTVNVANATFRRNAARLRLLAFANELKYARSSQSPETPAYFSISCGYLSYITKFD